MTLLELLIVMALLGIITTFSVGAYQQALDAARVARAIGDIKALEKDILTYEVQTGALPPALESLPRELIDDPWGNPYQYLNFKGAYSRGTGNGGGNGGSGNGAGAGGGSNSGGGQGGPGDNGGDQGSKQGVQGMMRKDRNLVPINSTFDLYSLGKDGKSASPITAAVSYDDIIRANDGSYVGLASGY